MSNALRIIDNMENEMAALRNKVAELEKPCIRIMETESDLFKKNLKGSKIVTCIVNERKLMLLDFKKVLTYVYGLTTRNVVLQNTCLNVVTGQRNENGFKYNKSLDISVQGAEARRTLKEILNIARAANIRIDLTIKLESGELVCYSM